MMESGSPLLDRRIEQPREFIPTLRTDGIRSLRSSLTQQTGGRIDKIQQAVVEVAEKKEGLSRTESPPKKFSGMQD